MVFIDVVKWNASKDVYAWKFPSQELSTWTQLIVAESQEAVLVINGQMQGPFKAGRYTLDTQNIPVISSLTNIPFGGQSPFSAEVWYVSKAMSLDVKWGTPEAIQLIDPKYGVMIPVRAYGQLGIQIQDSKKFLIKLVGSLNEFKKQDLLDYIKGMLLTSISDLIATVITKRKVSILEMSAMLEDLSKELGGSVAEALAEFGIGLVNFYVFSIKVPEQDPSVMKLRNMLSKRAEMNMLNFDYRQERSFDVMEHAAKNEGSSGDTMGAGLGMGLGFGMMQPMGHMMGGLASNLMQNGASVKRCGRCGVSADGHGRFCNQCGMSFDEDKSVLVCSACNVSGSTDSAFCQHCGKRYNICVHCTSDNELEIINCAQCGQLMAQACAACQAINVPGSKYCAECGEGLE